MKSSEELREVAKAFEDSEKQAKSIENRGQDARHEINKVSALKPNRNVSRSITCYSCGYEGHTRNDSKCSARGKKCRECKQTGRFESRCKTRPKNKTRNQKPRQGKRETSSSLPNVVSRLACVR